MKIDDEKLNVTILESINPDTLATKHKGRIFIGSMRFTSVRMNYRNCRRKTTSKRYKPYMENCFDSSYSFETEKQENYTKTFRDWGTFKFPNKTFKITGDELYKGHFGTYEKDRGYIIDFYPYEDTKAQFQESIKTI